MNIKITGYVEVTLKDKEGNIIAQEAGYNDVTEMSNNIVMDAILPRLGTNASPTTYPARAVQTVFSEPNGMSANAVTPYGSYYVGPAVDPAVNTSAAHAVNCIAYIAVGTSNSATNATFSNMGDSSFHSPGYSAFTATGDGAVGSLNVRKIDSVTFGGNGDSVTFTTTFGTTEGNLATDIAEIGIWTAGENTDADGFANVQTPTTRTGMRLFARRVLGNSITKTDDGTLDISYTLTFGA